MSYSIRGNAFVSHLQNGRQYSFHDSESKRVAFEQMARDDLAVRAAAQQRAEQAGVKRALSDREISQGRFLPDRRTAVERVADQVAARGAKHDPYQTAIDTVRAGQRMTDGPAKREHDEATIARLQEKSAALAQWRAENPPAAEPTATESTASALRQAAAQLKPASNLPTDQAQYAERKRRLLEQADAQDAKAVAESEHAAAVKKNEPWIVDADATLFRLSINPDVPQETVNAVRSMRDRLSNLQATGDEWTSFVGGVETQLKEIKAGRIAAKNAEIAELEKQKTAIRNDEPAAEPPATAPAA